MTQEKKGIVIDPNYVENEIKELMQQPVVQKLIYLQQLVKQSEEVSEELADTSKKKTK